MGLRSAAADWGVHLDIQLATDSSAAKGIASRTGLSKRTRHIAVHHLWLQERVENGDIVLEKIAGEKNPADLGTKHLVREKLDAN